jgi:predicted aldo/keto reductase-like oxidoreductase
MYKELMKVSCTGCGYCMPCPANVMIPLCFEEYNKLHMFGGPEEAKFRYALRMSGELADGKPGYASLCVNCGSCLEKCPQRIKIPEVLAQLASEMEDGSMPERLAKARTIFKVKPK